MGSNDEENHEASKEESSSSPEHSKEPEGPCELVEPVVVLKIRK